ncbi:hypothetical protein PY365_24555 [Roseiarcaceae bacterium H3SJ34-1]|uniref:hypothetical protein n=1 Tax=Terripilifer ovatus TaxID=3032367 RepID=UPI003AB92271|nr:hypothetical protein [Roseiarcaceae bacterium H3SJ34-1]
MKRTLIRYKTKPDATGQNRSLIEAVFQELKQKSPEGVRYMALMLEDGSFVHFVETEGEASVLQQLASFQAFQSGIRERCAEPPQAAQPIIVGNYRMLEER